MLALPNSLPRHRLGIVASRIKDQMHRPTFVFAPSQAPGKEQERASIARALALDPRIIIQPSDRTVERRPNVAEIAAEADVGGHGIALRS